MNEQMYYAVVNTILFIVFSVSLILAWRKWGGELGNGPAAADLGIILLAFLAFASGLALFRTWGNVIYHG